MASEVDPVVLELRAENGKYLSALRQSTTAVDAALGRQQKQVQSLENQFRKSSGAIANQLKIVAASMLGAFSTVQFGQVLDSFTRLQNNLRVTGLEGQKLEEVQGRLLNLSMRYGTSLEGLSGVFMKASMAQQSLGASTEDIIKLNEVIAASLKVTGTSATQAQGALLQLGQALGSGVVRAEEFNSLLEGAYPLAQAAARGIQRFGGDVAQLRIAIAAGKVTSQEFFQGVLRGGVETIKQAENATLTLSGAFESLNSAFTAYIGEGAKANGVTNALSSAIQTLAENLDIIIPALATIAAFMGVNMVASAVAGSRAYAAFLAVLTGTRTVASVATAGLTALTTALTGPAGVSLAVLAVGAGLYYMAKGADGSSGAIDKLTDSNSKAKTELDGMIAKLKAAGVQTDDLAAAADRASTAVDGLADSYRKALIEARNFSKTTAAGKIQEQSDIIEDSQKRQANLLRKVASADTGRGASVARFGYLPGQDANVSALRKQLELEKQREATARVTLQAIAKANATGVDLNAASESPAAAATTGGSPGSGRTPRGRHGPSAEEIEDRFNQEMISLGQQALSSRAAMALSAEERAELEARTVELARQSALNSINADQNYNETQKKRLRDALDNVADFELERIEMDKRLRLFEETNQKLALENDIRQDALKDEYDFATSSSERMRLAKLLIDGDFDERRAQLKRIEANEDLSAAQRERASIELAALNNERARAYRRAERDNESPLAAYRREVADTGNNMNDEYEAIAVSGLKALNDGLADAIMNSKNLGDVFKNVSKQIIADLIRIAIQQTIVNSLLGAIGGFFGGPTGAAGAKAASKIFNRASGGNVNAGQIYRVNESKREFFQPANSGNIIPLGEMNAKLAQSGASGGVVRVIVEEGPGFASKVRAEATGVAVEVVRASAPAIIQAGATEAQRNMTRPTMGRTY
jgi:tape measure domain-containing protein